MNLKPDFNRFLAAVHHKETDRVPLGEVLGFRVQRFNG